MPPRLAHKKSRRGCRRCKKRKVKCDELHPTCAACLRHNVPCSWPDDQDLLREPSSPDTPDTPASSQVEPHRNLPVVDQLPGPSSPYDVEGIDTYEPEDRRQLELHLLHYYLTVDTHNLPIWREPRRSKEIWTVDAVNLGFRHSFLINAIFAIAALHAAVVPLKHDNPQPAALFSLRNKHSSDPNQSLDASDYANAHRLYLNLATRELRQEISRLSSSNADAIVLTSIILSHVSQNLIPRSQPYEPPLQWLSMTNSLNPVFSAAQELLGNGSVTGTIIAEAEPLFRDTNTIFHAKFLAPFQAILDFDSNDEILGREDHEVYSLAFRFIGSAHEVCLRNDSDQFIRRRLISFGPMMPREFIDLLGQRQPRALLAIAYLMSMTKIVEECWWFHGEAERHVYGIQGLLPQKWQWAMQWPLDTLREMTELKESRKTEEHAYQEGTAAQLPTPSGAENRG